MKNIARQVRDYLLHPETGAGLFYVALCFGVLRMYLLAFVAANARGYELAETVRKLFSPNGPDGLFYWWALVSFALAAWLAYLLLRKRLGQAMLRRVFLVAVVHALGALRFYDWGMLLLSVLPLFALAPLLLLPRKPDVSSWVSRASSCCRVRARAAPQVPGIHATPAVASHH
jgi:hypothetical protein